MKQDLQAFLWELADYQQSSVHSFIKSRIPENKSLCEFYLDLRASQEDLSALLMTLKRYIDTHEEECNQEEEVVI